MYRARCACGGPFAHVAPVPVAPHKRRTHRPTDRRSICSLSLCSFASLRVQCFYLLYPPRARAVIKTIILPSRSFQLRSTLRWFVCALCCVFLKLFYVFASLLSFPFGLPCACAWVLNSTTFWDHLTPRQEKEMAPQTHTHTDESWFGGFPR